MAIAFFAVIFLIVAWNAYRRVSTYYETPHNEGDPVLYVERGCASFNDTWQAIHTTTIVITPKELILNDVLPWRYGSSQANPCTHTVSRSQITESSVGDFGMGPIEVTANVKVDYRDTNGQSRTYWIRSKEPSSIEHYLSR